MFLKGRILLLPELFPCVKAVKFYKGLLYEAGKVLAGVDVLPLNKEK